MATEMVIELGVVNDHARFQRFVNDHNSHADALAACEASTTRIVHLCNKLFADTPFDVPVTIRLTEQVTMESKDHWDVTPTGTEGGDTVVDAVQLVQAWSLWNGSPNGLGFKNTTDIVSLVSGLRFKNGKRGMSFGNTICNSFGGHTITDAFSTESVIALEMAHQLAHNMGLPHDTAPCTQTSGYVMQAVTPTGVVIDPDELPSQFSTCSIQFLKDITDNAIWTTGHAPSPMASSGTKTSGGLLSVLGWADSTVQDDVLYMAGSQWQFAMPLDTLVDLSCTQVMPALPWFPDGSSDICGDNVVSYGEECDEGGTETACCTSTCFLKLGAQCDPDDACCDAGCQSIAGPVCRASTGVCDLEDTCQGGYGDGCSVDYVMAAGSTCQESFTVASSRQFDTSSGTPMATALAKGQCMGGTCIHHYRLCQQAWGASYVPCGSDDKEAADRCTELRCRDGTDQKSTCLLATEVPAVNATLPGLLNGLSCRLPASPEVLRSCKSGVCQESYHVDMQAQWFPVGEPVVTDDDSGLSDAEKGGIIGGVIAAVVVTAVLILAYFLYRRVRRRRGVTAFESAEDTAARRRFAGFMRHEFDDNAGQGVQEGSSDDGAFKFGAVAPEVENYEVSADDVDVHGIDVRGIVSESEDSSSGTSAGSVSLDDVEV